MKGQRQPVAVVLINLGTPDELSESGVRRFLRQFLSDPRVVEIPRFLWLIILYLFVLPFRPRKVAEAYKVIWSERGSPLRWITEDQSKALGERFDSRYPDSKVTVTHAMTYGNPSIQSVMDELYESGHRRIVVMPMYPQYSGSTTGAVYDQVAHYMTSRRALPGISIVNAYFHQSAYIKALATSIETFWGKEGRGDHLLFSYHGIPKSYVTKGDPYAGHCECTTGAVVAELGLKESDYTAAYQSRFGKAEWIKPYTSESVEALGASGVGTLDVVCPAFAADCLETLEEIVDQNGEAFVEAGGKRLRLIPCLNASDVHIDALESILSPYLEAII